jgi:integrase
MPSIKFKATTIKFLRPTPGIQTDYFDASLHGFFLRVSPAGRKTFGVMYRTSGRFRRMTLGTYPPLTLKGARKMAIDALRDAAQGQDPAAKKAQKRDAESFSQLAAEYLERYAKPKKKSWQEDERIIEKNLIPAFGNMKAKEIMRRDVRELLDQIATRAPIMANRVRALLRKMFNWAILAEIVETNPVHLIPMPGKEQKRQRVLTEDEIKRFWQALDKEREGDKAHRKARMTAATSLKMRLLTAQRGIEVMGMQWDEVDGDWWTIPPERSKNKLAHRVPLTPMALRLLTEMKELAKERPSRFAFPSPKGDAFIANVQKTIQRVRKATGIDFRGHDLRRTAASLMTGMGFPRLTVSKILNHVEPGVTAVYDRHSYDREKRTALEAWNRRLHLMISGLQIVTKTDA